MDRLPSRRLHATDISLSASVEVGSIVFTSAASAFTFNPATSDIAISITGAGISNSSGSIQALFSHPMPKEVSSSSSSTMLRQREIAPVSRLAAASQPIAPGRGWYSLVRHQRPLEYFLLAEGRPLAHSRVRSNLWTVPPRLTRALLSPVRRRNLRTGDD